MVTQTFLFFFLDSKDGRLKGKGGNYLFTDSSQQNLTTTTEFFDHKNIKIDTKHEYADKMSNF